jgi:hypothetical protein
MSEKPIITFSTCWYQFKCKFPKEYFIMWMDNFLSNVQDKFYLVIYSDKESCDCILPYLGNKNIRLLLKPYTEFYGYKYKDAWIENHENNTDLNEYTDWKVNMLWCEKIHFVCSTVQKCKKLFGTKTDLFGWCDIGYFRGRPNDMSISELKDWPNPTKLRELDTEKIHYACVQKNRDYVNALARLILTEKNAEGIPPIPTHQNSIGGGFFIIHKDKLGWWRQLFDNTLIRYFNNRVLVKDDQIILADCIFSNLKHFKIHREDDLPQYDTWFLFQRVLA